ncbi:hypothetical protein BU15DRAFT_72587 [Melanogaster broomeanus]|nr:hypothetical protein BU15DRAFT_72587 [Melanogaster broomeanus]
MAKGRSILFSITCSDVTFIRHGLHSAPYLLTVLMVAAKYLNGSSPENKHWEGIWIPFRSRRGQSYGEATSLHIGLRASIRRAKGDHTLCTFDAYQVTQLSYPRRQEGRAAAIEKVTKGGKSRPPTQMPLTPPCGAFSHPPVSTSSSTVSMVRGLAKRLSSSRLNGPHKSASRPPPFTTVPSPLSSSNSLDNLVASDSETGSLTERTGSSFDSINNSENECDIDRRVALFTERFIL